MRTLKRSDTSVNSFLQKVEYYNTNFSRIKNGLTRGIDTAEISQLLPRFEKRLVTIKKLIDNDNSSNLRYLYTIRDLLTRSDDQLDEWQDKLSEMSAKLIQSEKELQLMHKDSLLSGIPADSTLLITLLAQKAAIERKWEQLDILNKKLLIRIGLLQNRVAVVYITILDHKDQVNTNIHNFGIRALSREVSYIWNMGPAPGITFASAMNASIAMNTKLLNFMVNRDTLIHLCSVLLFVIFFIWIYFNRRKVMLVRGSPREILAQTTYASRYPLMASLLIATVIAPNFYDHPPVVFLESIFLVMMMATLFLVKKTDRTSIFSFLHPLFWITVAFSISNLFIQVSNTDRLGILLLSIGAVLVALRFLNIVKQTPEQYLPYTRNILRIFIGLQIASIICNILGRFSLAKIIGIVSVYNLWLALGLYLMVQIIMESLFLQLEANKKNNGISSYLDFKILQKKLRSILNLIAVVLWVIMLTQNLSIEDLAFDYIKDVLNRSHQIGGTALTIGSIIMFIAVLWLSSIIAKVITYLYDFAGQHREEGVSKRKARTSMLLIKIGIFTAGFVIAVAASGVPMDKVTIIISALGVGIGFGLQNIVNNLVSGLILAFEKPVQVGDLIEVDKQSGRITDIGIRSSRIATSDGAEVIIPNGDLISRHVTNWTLSNDNRRVELIIGVAYGSDIAKVKEILTGLISNRDDIMKDPPPLVFVHNLNENSVDFRMLFWASDIGFWLQLKSSVLTDIYNSLHEAGIDIPFPQKEVYLHLADNERLKVVQAKPTEKPSET
ncbi:hypothetical protein GCM10028827_18600 [Mucilaginibacter myungsuensis]